MTSLRRCVHFNGIQKACAVGIDPMTVRAPRKTGAPMATFPCIDTGYPCATACSERRMMADEEVSAEDREIDAAVAQMEADAAAGRCHVCQARIEFRERVGRCEYARPCGHRIGQAGGDEVWS